MEKRPNFFEALWIGFPGTNKSKLLSLGLTTVLIVGLNFGDEIKQAEKSDLFYSQIYTQEIKKDPKNKKDVYKKYINSTVISKLRVGYRTKINDTSMGNEGSPRKEVRTTWKNNLINGYASIVEKTGFQVREIGRFESCVNILEKYSNNIWNESFIYTNGGISEVLKFISISFKNCEGEINEVKKLLKKHKDNKKIQHTLSVNESNTLNKKIQINKITLTESYNLFNWHRKIIFERLELFKIENPNDTLLNDVIKSDLNNFNLLIKRLNFSPNK